MSLSDARLLQLANVSGVPIREALADYEQACWELRLLRAAAAKDARGWECARNLWQAIEGDQERFGCSPIRGHVSCEECAERLESAMTVTEQAASEAGIDLEQKP